MSQRLGMLCAQCSVPPPSLPAARVDKQVNYFNAKPEHVRDNRYLAARIELEDLLDSEPEVVKQRREKLREVLVKVCSLPFLALATIILLVHKVLLHDRVPLTHSVGPAQQASVAAQVYVILHTPGARSSLCSSAC